MIDVAATEASAEEGKLVICPWAGRDTRNDRYRYRRHWRRDHYAPFMAETHGLLKWLFKAQYLGIKGVGAEMAVYK
jgi:hypothetical protein